MKISKIRIKNLFGIKEYEADGKDLELIGKEGTGKTSVLDAIKYAFTNKSARQYLIRNGEKEGEIYIETDTGLSITRKARTDKADYKSIKQTGDRVEKNESFLREIFTELQLNPIEFAEMPEQEQNRIILDLIDFKWDTNWIREQFGEIVPGVNYQQNILSVLHDIQSIKGHYYLTREDINREIRNKKAFIDEIGNILPAGYEAKKWESINLGELWKKIETIRNRNEQIRNAIAIVAGRETKTKEFLSQLQIKQGDIEQAATNEINIADRDIRDEEARIHNRKSSLKSKLSDIEKVAIVTKNDLEKEILELEAQIKQKRQDILDIGTKTKSRQEEAEKHCHQDVTLYESNIKQLLHAKEIIDNKKKSDLELAQKTYEANIAELDGEVKQFEDLAKQTTTPLNDLQSEAETTEAMKGYVNEYKRMIELKNDVESLTAESQALTGKIEKARSLPGEILEKSKVPIEGLTIKDGIPLINGLPISNLSSAEKFELCIGIATRNANSLNMILLDGIERMASIKRGKVYADLKAKGVQFIATRTTDDDSLTVIEL